MEKKKQAEKPGKKRGARALWAVAALVLGLSGCGKGPDGRSGAGFDYLRDMYPGLEEGHVFDSVTLERLVRILETDGTSLIVLASPLNESSRKTLPLIDQAARELGIEKIYHFDPHLGFDPTIQSGGTVDANQKGIVDIVADTGKPYSQFWKTLTAYEAAGESNPNNRYLSANYQNKGPLLQHIDALYTSPDTLLLAYNRKAGVPAGAGEAVFAQDGAEILAAVLVRNADSIKNAAFKTEAGEVLSHGVISGKAGELRLGQFEYFASWPYSGAAASPVTGAQRNGFKLQSVTYPELVYLLRQSGTNNILFSGSWCPDSRAAIGYIAENAAQFDASTVYVFDFRLDSNTSAAFKFTLGGTEYSYTTGNLSIFNGDVKSPYTLDSELLPAFTGHLGARIIDLFGKYNTGNNAVRPYYPDGDGAKNLVYFSNAKTRSPYLAQYNKDAVSGVIGQGSRITREWLHHIADWEAPFSSAEREQAAGDIVDYEFSSGDLTAAQKAAGRAALGTFFSGQEIVYTPAKITINENPGELDSGCGDDNDPIVNSGDAVLIPYHGTNEYDVERYDISIAFDPGKADERDAFTGTAIITARNTKGAPLETITLDFRRQAISGVTVNGGAVSTWEQRNEDPQNYQKLEIKLPRPIAPGANFTVEVNYSTGFIDTFIARGESPQGFSKSRNGVGGAVLGEPFGSTYWFPNNNTPADGAFYRISLTAPSSFTSAASGNRTGKTTRDNLTTTVWELDTPTAPYQVFAAFSNDYLEFSSQGSGLYKLNKITTADGRELDVYIYISRAVYNANVNRNRDKIDLFINKLPFYIRELEKIAGPYPGSSAGFVFDDLSNGSGDSAGWGAVETKDRPFYTADGVTGESTFVHEYAHQWFGNSVRPMSWKDLWLNEGFATYLTDLFYENTRNISAQAKYETLYGSTAESSGLWAAAAADIQKESDLFGGTKPAYYRGALTLASLRASLGDAAFFSILLNWNNPADAVAGGFKGKAAATADFIAFAQKASGKNLDAFSQAWLYTRAKPAAFAWKL